jgi:hypothetical protein
MISLPEHSFPAFSQNEEKKSRIIRLIPALPAETKDETGRGPKELICRVSGPDRRHDPALQSMSGDDMRGEGHL